MEVNESSLSVFYISKVLALAPISIRRDAKGVIEIKRSTAMTIYSIAFCLTLGILSYGGLLIDAKSEVPLRYEHMHLVATSTSLLFYIIHLNTRMMEYKIVPSALRSTFSLVREMNSATSNVVTALDVMMVALCSVSATGCALFSVNPTRELNARLRKFDAALHSFSNYKRDRRITRMLATIPLTVSAALIGYDIWTWILQVEFGPENGTRTSVKWYIPFYLFYFVMLGFHVLFANTAFGFSRRFYRLNEMLRSRFLSNNIPSSPVKTKISNIKITPDIAMSLHASLGQLNHESLPKESIGKTRVLLLRSLADNHESLGKCAQIFSNTYGCAVLFVLVSCLMHLVATAYFLFLALLKQGNTGYVWGQSLWILYHISRLLLVVEPCHKARAESKKTIQIVSEIERKIREPILAEEIKKFWQQLLVIDVDFSALGLCRINRNILATFSSAIATYLVILIQFQNASG